MNSKEKPKIIILGIDGLEYNLVTKWRLKNLMQKKFCKLDLSDFKIIVTPPIWGSMITGKIDKEITKLWERISKTKKLGGSKHKWWLKIVRRILPYSVIYTIWKKFFEKRIVGGNPFEIAANYVKEKNQPNIFQFFKRSWTNGVPGYEWTPTGPTERKLLNKVIDGNKKALVEYTNHILKKYNKDKSQLFSALEEKDYDLIFWYTNFLDHLGHIYIGDKLRFMKYYLEINNVVGKVKEMFPNSIIYVISDHGMEAFKGNWGMHSDHAFFSSNTGETIEKPFNLYDLISKYKSV